MTYICLLQILLFCVEAALDDSCTSEQTLLETPEGLVLNLDGRLFLQVCLVVEATLFEDWQEEIIFFLLRCVILIVLLAHLHLVTGLHVDGLLKDALEDVFGILGAALLIDCRLDLVAKLDLARHLRLLVVDLHHARHLQLVVLLLYLLLL